jgi:hypothetical protein
MKRVYLGPNSQEYYMPIGEFRPPKQGEMFLNRSLEKAFRATKDMKSSHHIARRVAVEPCKQCKGIGKVAKEG